jgi:hypothetical protein
MVNARIVFGTAWDYVILSFYSRFSTKLYEEPIYEEQSNSIIMIGLRGEDTFHGESKIVKIDAENLELENKGTVLKGTKKAQNATKIECLSFTEGDFYNEDRGLGDVLQIMNLQ